MAVDYQSWESRTTMARAVRVMARLGYFDPACHASARTSDGILITPDFDSPNVSSPRTISGDQIVIAGVGHDLASVPEWILAFHQSIYAARDDVGAVLFVYPPSAMASVAARYPQRRTTHAEAWMVETVAPFADVLAYVDAPADIVGSIGSQHRIVCVPGVGIAFLASDIDTAIADAHSYEYLARMNLLASSLPRKGREVTSEEIRLIQADRGTTETVGSVDGRVFLRSFDEDGTMPVVDDDGSVSARIAISCRILASHRTLVGFYEHVSHRLEGGNAFAMSPAKNFSQMTPEDILTVGLDEGATWISGSNPPAPFRRFHRDIFLARPDVAAIVHTHEMYGRLFMTVDSALAPLDRYSVGISPTPPRLGRASMVFGEQDRRDAVSALGREAVFHTDFHGTDYVAETIEEATVMAVHREVAYRTLHTALRLGDPVALTTEEAAALSRILPGPGAWWRLYSDLLADGRFAMNAQRD